MIPFNFDSQRAVPADVRLYR